MNREALLEELGRLLDAGEPLLDVFPIKHPDGYLLQLPDNISHEMEWYAGDVALRAEDRKRYHGYRQHETTGYLARLVRNVGSGLLGWRAIGVLK